MVSGVVCFMLTKKIVDNSFNVILKGDKMSIKIDKLHFQVLQFPKPFAISRRHQRIHDNSPQSFVNKFFENMLNIAHSRAWLVQ